MGDHHDIRIGFIGGGNMAQAIIRGLIQAGHPAGTISVADPDTNQRSGVASLHADIGLAEDNISVAGAADVLVLAVKPQIMAEVVAPLGQAERPVSQVVISVAAGITLASMQEWLGADAALVRVMPNQPALVGAGMSGLCANAGVSESGRDAAAYVMEATGRTIWFDDEALMDAVTAVSGSGPAYFYLVMEIMQEVAEEFGFDTATARLLATQTAFGAGSVAADSNEALADLRSRVTSPGGTTAAALESLEAAGIRDMFRTALQAARQRSIELGRGG
jgi:pyrroline-5-carboxylate reductase